MMKRSDFEIMAPVGSYDSLTAAIQGGADSVYFGIEGMNMRARSSNNFTIDDLHEIVRICNEHRIKSYLTVNTVSTTKIYLCYIVLSMRRRRPGSRLLSPAMWRL